MADSRSLLVGGVVFGSLWLPGFAHAADTLYAHPNGLRTDEPCPLNDPCKLTDAAADADSGDEVIALAGTYTLTTTPVNIGTGVTLRGAPGPRPLITTSTAFIPFSATSNDPAQPTRFSHLKIDAPGGGPSLLGHVTASDLIVSTTASTGVGITGAGGTVRDSIVIVSGSNGKAIRAAATGTGTVQVRNVTAIATGPTSHGIWVEGSAGPGCMPVTDSRAVVRNTIARGTAFDLRAQGATGVCSAVGSIDVANSNYRSVEEVTGGDVIEGAGNQKTPAQTDLAAIFVNQTDYRQLESAPTYNAGEPNASDAGMVDPDGDPRVGDGRVDIGADELPSAPLLTADPPSALGETSATMAGRVNPSGRAAAYKFEYGPTAALGSETAEVALDAAQPETAVTEPLTGLAPGQTVFYRLRARAGGHQPRSSVSEIVSFTTPAPAAPTVFTGGVSAITLTSAVLDGTVDPNRRETTWRFVYGPTTDYGAETAAVSAGEGDSEVPVSATVEGLTPGSLYHYRLEATNALGTSVGADATLTTQTATTDPTGPTGPTGPGTETEPLTLSGLSVTPKRFRRGSALPKISATGTKIRFTVSQPARVTFTFFRKQPGRRVGKVCKRPTRANRRNRRCTRLVRKGALSLNAAAGARTLRFSGRLTKKRSLPPGRYKLVARATDAAGTSTRPAPAGFTLLRSGQT